MLFCCTAQARCCNHVPRIDCLLTCCRSSPLVGGHSSLLPALPEPCGKTACSEDHPSFGDHLSQQIVPYSQADTINNAASSHGGGGYAATEQLRGRVQSVGEVHSEHGQLEAKQSNSNSDGMRNSARLGLLPTFEREDERWTSCQGSSAGEEEQQEDNTSLPAAPPDTTSAQMVRTASHSSPTVSAPSSMPFNGKMDLNLATGMVRMGGVSSGGCQGARVETRGGQQNEEQMSAGDREGLRMSVMTPNGSLHMRYCVPPSLDVQSPSVPPAYLSFHHSHPQAPASTLPQSNPLQLSGGADGQPAIPTAGAGVASIAAEASVAEAAKAAGGGIILADASYSENPTPWLLQQMRLSGEKAHQQSKRQEPPPGLPGMAHLRGLPWFGV